MPILAIRHVPHESLGLLSEVFAAAGVEVEFADQYAQPSQGRVAFDPKRHRGLVVMGGPMNVDETDVYPFLATEVEWIRRAVETKTPVLGICLGAQLIAKALGARVYPNERGGKRVKEIGWFNVKILPAAKEDPLFHDCKQIERVFQWHGDTFDLPAGATQLARSIDCEQQAFRYGPNCWAIQYHWEITPENLETWLAEPGMCCELAGLPQFDAAVIRNSAPREFPNMTALAKRVFERFAKLVA